MRASTTSSRALMRLVPADLPFVPMVALLLAYSLDIPDPAWIAGVGAVIALVRAAIWIVALRMQLAPVDAWERASTKQRTDALFGQALDATRRTPARFLRVYGLTWALALVVMFAIAIARNQGADGLSPRFWISAALVLFTIVLASGVFAYTWSGSLLLELAIPIQLEAQRRGHGALRPGQPIGLRITILSMIFAVAALGWLGAIGHRNADQAAVREAELVAQLAAREAAAGARPADRAEGAEGAALHVLGAGDGAPADLAAWARDAASESSSGSRRQPGADRAAAFAVGPEGRIVLAIVPVSTRLPDTFLYMIAGFLFVVSVWASLSSLAFGRDVAAGVDRLTGAAARMVEVGDLGAMEALPVLSSDEIGEATQHLNELVETLRELSRSTERVAAGDLEVVLPGKGELQDSFRRMLESLQLLVSQLRDTTMQLASAAAEIYSASQEQEAAASQQSAGITEVSRTMDSLAGAAGHIADSTGDVLGDAERTRATTDQMAARIAELNAHTGRITELLETIRDVADRSDLLALNGSLEATRAGEAGRGFTLVASEMRRLAERVTATVESVRGLVGDVRASGSSTVMATDQSRKLAESTTEAARRISLVTQQQRTATEQVTVAVREIADVIAQAAVATTQTRVSAEELKALADRLDLLLQRFEVAPNRPDRRAA